MLVVVEAPTAPRFWSFGPGKRLNAHLERRHQELAQLLVYCGQGTRAPT